MKKEKKKLIYVHLNAEEENMIKNLSESLDLPKARIIRGIITAFLKENANIINDFSKNEEAKKKLLEKIFL